MRKFASAVLFSGCAGSQSSTRPVSAQAFGKRSDDLHFCFKIGGLFSIGLNAAQGTGRQTTAREVQLSVDNLVGRRSGVRLKPNVPKGSDGFDDVQEFWEEDGETVDTSAPKPAAASPKRRSVERQTPAKAPNSTPASMARIAKTSNSTNQTPEAADGSDGPDDNAHDYGHDDGGGYDEPLEPAGFSEPLPDKEPAKQPVAQRTSKGAAAVSRKSAAGRQSAALRKKPSSDGDTEPDDGDAVAAPVSQKQPSQKPARKSAPTASQLATPANKRLVASDDENAPLTAANHSEADTPAGVKKRKAPSKVAARARTAIDNDNSDEDEESFVDEEDVGGRKRRYEEGMTPGGAILSPDFDMRRLRKSIGKQQGPESGESSVVKL